MRTAVCMRCHIPGSLVLTGAHLQSAGAASRPHLRSRRACRPLPNCGGDSGSALAAAAAAAAAAAVLVAAAAAAAAAAVIVIAVLGMVVVVVVLCDSPATNEQFVGWILVASGGGCGVLSCPKG